MTDAHTEKETLSVEINIPAHADRTVTPLFHSSRIQLLKRMPYCYICGCSLNLEAHHYPIERCLTEMIDWKLVAINAKMGNLGITQEQRDAARAFDFTDIDKNPYRFVDDMTVNGLTICKTHHIGKDEGIHAMPHPLWIGQKYGKDGYKFSSVEVIHHDQQNAG